MFYTTNLKENELAALLGRKVENSVQTYTDFKMSFPMQLELITMHPKDPEHYFTMASLAPDRVYYAATTREEMGTLFSKNSLHHHSYYELLFILEGNVYQIIENKRHLYTPGSCCLLNKNVLHAEEHDTDFRVAFLGISDAVLSEVCKAFSDVYFSVEKERRQTELDRFLLENLSDTGSYEKKYIDFIPKANNKAITPNMHHLFDAVANDLMHPSIGSSYMIRSHIAKLFYLLSDPANFETHPIQIGTDAENLLYNQIDRIMHETYGRASRSFLESELHYSGDYLNKITKKYTGMNIHDFGMTICMGRAADELLTTKRSISDVAAGLGFSNRTHFYKQFEKVYHLSPAEYRKKLS